MSLAGGVGHNSAVGQLVAHQGRTELQVKKRDREEFNRRMNAKKELPRLEARTSESLIEELEKFDEFLIDAKPKDSYETLEYLKNSLKGEALEEWKWVKQTPQGIAMLAAAANDDMAAYDDLWVWFVGNLCARVGLDRSDNPMTERIKREFEGWRLKEGKVHTREDCIKLIGELRGWYLKLKRYGLVTVERDSQKWAGILLKKKLEVGGKLWVYLFHPKWGDEAV
jgi:hypothetical protein